MASIPSSPRGALQRGAFVSGTQPAQQRLFAGTGAAVAVALLGYGLLTGLDVHVSQIRDKALAVLDVSVPPPPPPPKREPPKPQQIRERAKEAPAPPNLRNKATPVVVPPPVVHLPPPPPRIVVAPQPGTGMAPNTGASDRPGPGTGAGGIGDGTGGGGDGEGGDTPPRQIRGALKFSDLPPELREAGAQGAVAVRYRVEVDGRVTGCMPRVTSGPSGLGPATCAAIERKFRFKPSLDPDGRPVSSSIVETHSWYIDRSGMRDDDE